MKALILTISTGEGHNSTAKAISDYLKSHGVECETLDTYSYMNTLLGKTVSKGYLFSVDNLKTAFAKIYNSLEHRKSDGNHKSPTRLANYVFLRKMEKYLQEYKPDVIISTHIFAAMIIDILKQKKIIDTKTLGIVTDYTVHPFWEECIHFDYLVIANEVFIPMAVKKGFDESKVLPFGIPINPVFSEKGDRAEIRKNLGLDPDKTTFLVMSGSMGYGDPSQIIKAIDDLPYDFQIISVCGNNAKAKESIDKMEKKKKIINFGFTSEIPSLMDASDCVIGKPGGLTTSEALAKGLPMIIVNPIPGHEERNTEFLLNSGAGMAVSPSMPIDTIITELMSSPDKLDLMKEAVQTIRKPNSTKDICDFIIGLEK